MTKAKDRGKSKRKQKDKTEMRVMGRGTGWEATRTGGNAGVGVGGNADEGGGQTRRTDEASDEAGGNRRNLSVTEVCDGSYEFFFCILLCLQIRRALGCVYISISDKL